MIAGSNSIASSPTVNGGFQHSNSPLPYLFGGLALMLGIIAMALMILACSYKKPSSPSDNSHEQQHMHDEHQRKRIELQMEMEPKIVVIMAGDSNPTYFAKPDMLLCTCQTEPQI